MFKVIRPDPGVLVISASPAQALIRLSIWAGVVVVFYLVVLGGVPVTTSATDAAKGRDFHDWLLLLFPVFLLPYLFNCIRALSGAGGTVFDGPTRTISRGRRPLAEFSEICELQLRPVNATCEEICLAAALADGRILTLLESKRALEIDTLAEEIGQLIGVRVTRAT